MSEKLPRFPAKWLVVRIRRKLRGADGIRIGPFGSALTLDQMVESGFKVYGQENVIADDFTAGKRFINSDKYSELKNCSVLPGDLLVTMMGTTGRCVVVPEGIAKGIMDSHLIRLRFRDADVDPAFMSWLIDKGHYVKEQIKAGGKGTIMSGLNSSIIKDVWIGLPDRAMQAEVIRLADAATGKIDQLVGLRRRQMELLQEQRAALIQQAVTRGINPKVPLKDSGIPWLGMIPRHWEIIRLGRLAHLQGGYAFDSRDFVDEGIPVIRMNNLKRGELDVSESVKVAPEKSLAPFAIKSGDVLLGMSGSIGETGSLGNYAFVSDEQLPLQLNQRVGRFIVHNSKLSTLFVRLLVQSNAFAEQIMLSVTGTAQFNISGQQVESVVIAVPPKTEQKQIVDYVEHASSRLVGLSQSYARQIELLGEYRAALIHEAVTGQTAV